MPGLTEEEPSSPEHDKKSSESTNLLLPPAADASRNSRQPHSKVFRRRWRQFQQLQPGCSHARACSDQRAHDSQEAHHEAQDGAEPIFNSHPRIGSGNPLTTSIKSISSKIKKWLLPGPKARRGRATEDDPSNNSETRNLSHPEFFSNSTSPTPSLLELDSSPTRPLSGNHHNIYIEHTFGIRAEDALPRGTAEAISTSLQASPLATLFGSPAKNASHGLTRYRSRPTNTPSWPTTTR
ncbi:hypothetical protein V8F20_007102 [Naviculisporaceae sp. PSN 640]